LDYLWLQQSPGQQEDCCWQQLWPQHEPAQHFALFLQQAAPVAARADSVNSEVAIRAKTLAFMEISSPCEQGMWCAEAQDQRGKRV